MVRMGTRIFRQADGVLDMTQNGNDLSAAFSKLHAGHRRAAKSLMQEILIDHIDAIIGAHCDEIAKKADFKIVGPFVAKHPRGRHGHPLNPRGEKRKRRKK